MKYGIDNTIDCAELAYKTLESALESLEKMDFDSASEAIKKVLDFNLKNKILEDDEELMAIEALGIALLGLECHEEGIEYIKDVYDRLSSQKGDDDLSTLAALDSLGEAYLAIGQSKEALDIFQKEYRARIANNPLHEDAIKAGSLYALSLRLENKALDAVAVHKENLEKIEKLKLACNILIEEIMELGNCYIELNQGEKALECFDMAYNFSLMEYTECSPISQEILLLKIKALARLRRFDEIIALAEKAKRIEAIVENQNEKNKFLKTIDCILEIIGIGFCKG